MTVEIHLTRKNWHGRVVQKIPSGKSLRLGPQFEPQPLLMQYHCTLLFLDWNLDALQFFQYALFHFFLQFVAWVDMLLHNAFQNIIDNLLDSNRKLEKSNFDEQYNEQQSSAISCKLLWPRRRKFVSPHSSLSSRTKDDYEAVFEILQRFS